MQAVWLEDCRLSRRNDLPVPEPAQGEALVRVRLGGICATDLEMVKGYYPFTGVLGHEFVGETVQPVAGPGGLRLEAGRRVVGEINAACGACSACQAGRRTHCEQRTVLGIFNRDGVFAEYVSLPVENLHPVPDGVPDQAAVFTEPLAAALEIQEQVHLCPDLRVVLIGAGRLGQLVAQTLALTGCDLSVVARHPVQRRLLEARGIRCLLASELPEKRADVVVEATGSQEGFYLAQRTVRPRGTLVLKSTYKGEIQVNFSRLVVDEITLVGSRCGPFSPALRLLESGLVDPTPLIAAEFALADGLAAFERAAQPGVLKVLLHP